jgi:hypothetical protein
VEEAYKLIKRDLEEVVEGEVRELLSLIDCPKARVMEDTEYFEFRLERPPSPSNLPFNLPRLPVMIIYVPKAYVTVLEFKVEFVRDNDVPLAMAIVRYYFTTSTPTACFKDYLIIPANIEDVALEIIRGGDGK